MMVGREVLLERAPQPVTPGAVQLALRGVGALGVTGQPALRDVSLEIRAGEILGVAGVSGNGQHELAEVIAGLRPLTSGQVEIAGKDMTHWSPGQRTAAGWATFPKSACTTASCRNSASPRT